MRTRTFLLRWLLILTAGGFGLHYAWRLLDDGPSPPYRTVPLVQGSKSVGLHLAGIAVDPIRRDVFAIVGGETKTRLAGDFFILMRGTDGERCGLRVFDREKKTSVRYEIRRPAQLLAPDDLKLEDADGAVVTSNAANTEAAVHSIVQSLPEGFDLFGKP